MCSKSLSVFLAVLSLVPVDAAAQQVANLVQRATEAPTTPQVGALSVDASEQLVEVPQRLLRTFELFEQPGIHPEFVELLGLEAEVAADRESSLASTTTGPAALDKGAKIAIVVDILAFAIVSFVYYCATHSQSCGG